MRRNFPSDNRSGESIRECPLQAVPDFNAKPAVILRHKQNDTVIPFLLPGHVEFRHAHRKIFNTLIADCRKHQDNDLSGCRIFKAGETTFKFIQLPGRERVGLVRDPLYKSWRSNLPCLDIEILAGRLTYSGNNCNCYRENMSDERQHQNFTGGGASAPSRALNHSFARNPVRDAMMAAGNRLMAPLYSCTAVL